MSITSKAKQPISVKSIPLDHTHLIVGNTLPSTHLRGKITIFWGSKTSSQDEIPKLSFSIDQSYIIPVGYQPNDYVIPSEKERKEKYEIKLVIYHSSFPPNTLLQEKEQNQKLKKQVEELKEQDKSWLKDVWGRKEIIVDTTGMKVIKKQKDNGNNGNWFVELEGIGQRTVRYGGNDEKLKIVMSDITPPSQAPDWFTSSAPTVSSPPQPPSQSPPSDQPSNSPSPNNYKKGESSSSSTSKLKPLTSFHPPDLTLTRNPSKSSTSTSSHSSNPSRPTKRPSLDFVNDNSKRAKGKERGVIDSISENNLAEEEELVVSDSSTPKEKDKSKGPRTVVQLGPPGFQAFVNSHTAESTIVKGKEREKELERQPLKSTSSTEVSVDEQIEEKQQPHPVVQNPATELSVESPPIDVEQQDQARASLYEQIEYSNQPTQNQSPQYQPPLPVTPHNPPEDLRATPLREMTPFRPRSTECLNHHQVASSSPYPSRRQSIPVISQSSPLAFTPRAEREKFAIARRRAEEQRRGEAQVAQAESSRIAQERAKDVERLEKPLYTDNIQYTPLKDLKSFGLADLIGVVVKITAPTKPKDFMVNVILCDPSRHSNLDPPHNEALVVSIFRARESELPLDVTPGEVMLFRGLKMTMFNGKTKAQAFSGSHNTWVILKNEKQLKFADQNDMNPPLGRAEVDRMVDLYKWSKGVREEYGDQGFGGSGSSPGLFGLDSPSSRRSSTGLGIPRDEITLGQVLPSTFFDAVFKIMHVVRNTHRKPDIELYISDGTTSSYHLRNFHNIQIEGIPPEALFTLAIHDIPPSEELRYFEAGKMLKLNNVRSKVYRGEFELSWSELPTSEQAQQGWKRRRCNPIGKEDGRAKVIEGRLRALKRGEVVDEPPRFAHQPITPNQTHNHHQHQPIDPLQLTTPTHPQQYTLHSTIEDRPQPFKSATHIRTIYTDPTEHPVSTISDIISNMTLPNKYRIIAKIISIHSRDNNDTLIQPYCNHCKSSFKGTWCQSCNDLEGDYSEWKYRFVVVLQDQKGGELACLVGDDEAAEFLPALPPWSNSTNPNDLRKSERRRIDLSGQVYSILQGAKMDGIRTKPFIEISLEVYQVFKPSTEGEEEERRKVVVARIFGMSTQTH